MTHRLPLTRRLATAVVAMLACLLFGSAFATTPQTKVNDQEVKAALLFRVSKFIEWPASAFSSPTAPFVMCVVGDDSRVRAFQPLQGKALNGRSVAVRRITGDMLDLGQCHAAYFPEGSEADVDYALGKLRGAPVLTVGETDAFVQRGGVLALVTRDQRVQFTIHAGAAKRAQLSVSSQLLQLAIVIGEDAP